MTTPFRHTARAIIAAIIALQATACLPDERQESKNMEQAAENFADAYFNHDYAKAVELATPESERFLRFRASNISEADVNMLNQRGQEATVSIKSCEQTSDSSATAIIAVEDYLSFDSIEGGGRNIPSAEYRLQLVKRGKRWLAKDIEENK